MGIALLNRDGLELLSQFPVLVGRSDKPNAVLNLPADPNLCTKFGNRALADVLCEYRDVANIWDFN